MLAFNFLMAFRSMLKNRVTSAINLFGLSASFTALLLIMMFVIQELSYDKYHEKANRIFRISREGMDANGQPEIHFGHVNFALAEHLRKEFPDQVEKAIRFSDNSNTLVANEEAKKSFVETSLFFADPGVFDVFSWNLVKGNHETVLKDINTIAISQSAAQRYFDDADPIGKMLLVNNEIAMQVTGVFEDVPTASHFKPTILMSMATREKLEVYEDLMRNQSNNDATYVLLREGANLETLKEQMPITLDRYYELLPDGRKSSQANRYYFWPLKEIHLNFVYDSSTEPNGNYMVVYIFMGTAVLILLIACINFINLSTARLSQRAKEVGLKKAIGALRVTLFSQFIAEAFLFASFSLILALGASYLLLPSFNAFLAKELSLAMIVTGHSFRRSHAAGGKCGCWRVPGMVPLCIQSVGCAEEGSDLNLERGECAKCSRGCPILSGILTDHTGCCSQQSDEFLKYLQPRI
jgi:putative ABC transport system permease protein